MKKLNILLSLLFVTGMAFGQITTRDITWSSAKSVELHSSVDVVQPATLITRTSKQIDYVVNNNTLTFTITSIDGTWADASANGKLTYKVKYQNRAGKVILERTTAGITATIDFTESAANALQQKILIDRFE